MAEHVSVETTMLRRPPINRAMRVLDRKFFERDITLSAARIFDARKTSDIRGQVMKSKDMLLMRSIYAVRADPFDTSQQRKCVLLKESTRPDGVTAADRREDQTTWSETIAQLKESGDIDVFAYPYRIPVAEMESPDDILWAVLPEELHTEIPTGFNHVGHIAHLNLREPYLPYKELIGQVILDKNQSIRTVVNKTDTLGETNEFRVLEHELLAGEPAYDVEAREEGCVFRFNFSRVFWNSKLSGEHRRLVAQFRPGEAVCDLMAGVGPFAIPAGRKGVFVWANDLNPDCHASLMDAIAINKVDPYVRGFCEDGHTFIKDAAQRLLREDRMADIPKKLSRTQIKENQIKREDQFDHTPWPKFFSHYVMNLPATAVDFLPDFAGLYADQEQLFEPHTQQRLPMVHCYCFAPKMDFAEESGINPLGVVCDQLTEKLRHSFTPSTPELEIHNVRDVAPNKSQYCASFRLPAEVAFRQA